MVVSTTGPLYEGKVSTGYARECGAGSVACSSTNTSNHSMCLKVKSMQVHVLCCTVTESCTKVVWRPSYFVIDETTNMLILSDSDPTVIASKFSWDQKVGASSLRLASKFSFGQWLLNRKDVWTSIFLKEVANTYCTYKLDWCVRMRSVDHQRIIELGFPGQRRS